MTKKDILKMETIAYYSGFNGLKYKRGIVIYDYTKGAY